MPQNKGDKRVLPHVTDIQADAILKAAQPLPTEEFLDILLALAQPYVPGDPTCFNCGEPESKHGGYIAYCPEDEWFSQTMTFRKGDA